MRFPTAGASAEPSSGPIEIAVTSKRDLSVALENLRHQIRHRVLAKNRPDIGPGRIPIIRRPAARWTLFPLPRARPSCVSLNDLAPRILRVGRPREMGKQIETACTMRPCPSGTQTSPRTLTVKIAPSRRPWHLGLETSAFETGKPAALSRNAPVIGPASGLDENARVPPAATFARDRARPCGKIRSHRDGPSDRAASGVRRRA